MIARVKFEGTTGKGKNKSTLIDQVDIHVQEDGLEVAKEIFLYWLEVSAGIKGDSGVFHPLKNDGSIKIKSVTEKP